MTPLREKMIKELKLARYSEKTNEAYLRAAKGLAEYYWRSPEVISTAEARDYLHHLMVERKLSWSTCNVAASGLAFLYGKVLGREDFRAQLPSRKLPRTQPQVLSVEEVNRLFEVTKNPKHRVLLMTAYGAGLRVSEVVRLKVTDIESDREMIRVEQGKGRKDRRVLLSKHLLGELRTYWRIECPPVWLFPGKSLDHHLSIGAAQRAYYRAKKAAGIQRGRGIHTLRHCFATHMLEAGADSTEVQMMMGHRSIATTIGYLHVTERRLEKLKGPLDKLFQSKSVDPE